MSQVPPTDRGHRLGILAALLAVAPAAPAQKPGVEGPLSARLTQLAERAGVRRIVYLSGLHPAGELSEHLASRVEVAPGPTWPHLTFALLYEGRLRMEWGT